jgi:septum formation protein
VRLILASASPQRRVLLEEAGYEFEIIPADVEEATAGMSPKQLAQFNAQAKAEAVSVGVTNAAIIGSDTVVALGNRSFGKPESFAEAAAMLSALSGQEHEVHSAVSVAVVSADGIAAVQTLCDSTTVVFHELSTCRIEAHLALGEWQGRAGGYAIQESGSELVANLGGAFDTVVGLPMHLTAELLPDAVQPNSPR